MEAVEKGLSTTQALKLRAQYGPNEIILQSKKSVIFHFLKKLFNPLIITLIFVAGLSFFLGENVNSIIIIAMALLSVILSFVQEHNASRAAEKLRAMVKINATVLRNGQKIELPLREIVPGDVIELTAGKMVPADVKIINSKDLYINQAALTGESFPAKKNVDDVEIVPAETIFNSNHLAFLGSNVASGIGEALVLKTGKETEFGKLSAKTIGSQTTANSFDRGINRFIWLMVRFTFVLVLFIFVINAIFKTGLLESLLFSLAIAISLTPEMLPMMVAINLSKGAMEMARKRVIVKELTSIQNFGAMDVLCIDKTGTLTINNITLIKHCDFRGIENDEILKFAYLNSSFQTGLDNLLDNAVIKHKKFDLAEIKKIDELPFDFNRRIMSVIVEENNHRLLISKGAPEEILNRANSYTSGNDKFPLDKKILADLNKKYEEFSQDGFRVLAIAYKTIENKSQYSDDDENDLIFSGFIAFLDPPKSTAQSAIVQLKNLGINLKILTGDNVIVTKKICQEVGIPIQNALSGEQIDQLNDLELQQSVEKTNIFSRLDPIQKERIVKAIQKNNHAIGYLGDGINDAPALKAADVGISVDNATDIAKETAQIILLEKELTVLSDCIDVGRKNFGNTIKYLKVGSSSNFGNMISLAGASIFLPFLPALPTQLLLNDFLYDVSQVTLPTDNVDKDYLAKPKIWDIKFIEEFMLYFGSLATVFDLITFAFMWYVFHASPELFRTGWFVESLATQILIVYIIRTRKIPFFESFPSLPLLLTTLGIVILGAILPYTKIGRFFEFVPLSFNFFIFLIIIVLVYLVFAQILKNWFIKKFGYE